MLPSPHNDMVPELPGAGGTGAPIVTIVAPCYNIFEQTKQRPLYLINYTPGDRA